MKTITLSTKLQVPAFWKDLLAIEELPENTPKAHGVADNDPTAYRDDGREVSMTDGNYLIILGLCSGSSNYWLNYEVQMKRDDETDFRNADIVYQDGEPFFDLPENDELKLSTGDTISFDIVTVSPEPGWIDRHSVNCFKCGKLVDERNCIPGPEGEGDICPDCQDT